MEATFEQWVMDAKQNTLQNVTGTMWIQRPGQFRWNTADPYPQQIVSDGKELWIYDEDLEQATRKTLDKQVGNTPALLLSGDPSRIADGFQVSAYRFDETGSGVLTSGPKIKTPCLPCCGYIFIVTSCGICILKTAWGRPHVLNSSRCN